MPSRDFIAAAPRLFSTRGVLMNPGFGDQRLIVQR
jgi:hypothetical protein